VKTSLFKIAAASAVLAPAAIGTRLAGAVHRAWIAVDVAAGKLAQLGITEQPIVFDPIGGGRSNAVYRVGFGGSLYVLKVALSEGTLLAFAARWVGPQPYARDVTAAARIGREAAALRALHAAGLRVPRVIAAAPEVLLVDHVDGEPLPSTLHRPGGAQRIRAYAGALRAVHAAGFAIADAHPGNALVGADGEVTLIDLEFAEPTTDPARFAFDIAYASQYFTGAERRTFLTAVAVDVSAELGKLADLGLLFALERRRQRKVAMLAIFESALPEAA